MPLSDYLPWSTMDSQRTRSYYDPTAIADVEDVELQPLSTDQYSHAKKLQRRLDSLRSAIASELANTHCRIDPRSEWADIEAAQLCGYRTYLSQADTILTQLQDSKHLRSISCPAKLRRSSWLLGRPGGRELGLTEDQMQVYDRAAHRLDRIGRRLFTRSAAGASLGGELRDIAFLTHLAVLDHTDSNLRATTHADALLWSFVNAHTDADKGVTGGENWLMAVNLRRGRAALSTSRSEVTIPCTTAGCDCFQTANTLRLAHQRSVRAKLANDSAEGISGGGGMREVERRLMQTALDHSVHALSEQWGFRVDEVLDGHEES